MSSKKQNARKYELKERVGPAATTVAEIARRAGVSRLTVYKHYPDDASLYEACSAHYRSQHPLPDFELALSVEDPVDRVRAVLRLVYGEIYRENRRMIRNLSRDRGSDPALDALMKRTRDALLDGLAEALSDGFDQAEGARGQLRAMMRLGLDFWTWERLTGDGLDDEAAAELMTDAVAAIAGATSPAAATA